MNKVIIIGRLTSAPTVTTTRDGKSVARMTVAVNRTKNREKTDYLDVTAWRELADLCAKYLVKGQQIAVSGELHKDAYEDRDGKTRASYNIVANDIEFLAKPAEVKDEAPAEEKPVQGDIFAGAYVEEDLPF